MSTRQRVMRSRSAFAPSRTLVAFAAVATLAAPAAWADSGLVGDTTLGNSVTPLSEALRLRDAEGLGAESANHRTPTGFLQVAPYVFGEKTPLGDKGWVSRGSIELGGFGVSGDRNAALWRTYRDVDRGGYLAGLSFEVENPKEGLFIEGKAGGIGYDDQYAGVSFGRHNGWKVSAFYNETPHVYTTTYRNLWDGVGTSNLTLRGSTGLQANGGPGATAATAYAALKAAVPNVPYSTLEVKRDKGGLRFEMQLSDATEVFVSLTNERRKGARPLGMTTGANGGTNDTIDIPESINYDTTDVVAGLQWSNRRTSVNVQAAASLFRNNVDTLTVQDPLFVAPSAATGIASFPRARFDLYPDNDMYNLKAEVAHSMPELARLRLTGVVSLTEMRQNDALIASTLAPATVGGIAGGAWDTTDSLSRKSAKQRLDTQLIDLGAAFSPANGVDVRAKLRRFETKNKTPEYYACNPLTGQWGRLMNDGFAAPIINIPAYNALKCDLEAIRALGIVPTNANTNIAAVPYQYTQDNISAAAEWRFARTQTVNASLERETMKRENREYSRTHEDRLKLGYVNRDLGAGTLRASIEGAQRRGNTYNPDPYEEYYSASMGPEPTTGSLAGYLHTNGLMRKYDLADRDTTTLNLRFNTALAEDLDLMVTGQLREMKYPDSLFGRIGKQTHNSINFDLNWQPTARTSIFGFAAFQDGKLRQKNVQQTNSCIVGTTYNVWSNGQVLLPTAVAPAGATLVGTVTPTAANFLTVCGDAGGTSPMWPSANAWSFEQKDRNSTFGIGGRHDFGPVRVDATYTWTEGITKTRYQYGPGVNPNPTALGSGFPDMKIRQEALDANLMVPLTNKMTLRLLVRHERGKIRDWHYEGIAANPTPGPATGAQQQVYLDAGPQDYRVTAVGAFLQVAW